MTLKEKAQRLLQLHDRRQLLVLPNAWDVASARAIESVGFPAIATSSAGVAAVFGYPDGENIPRELMIDMVARICAKVKVPVTADLESGYGGAGETVKAALQAGAVGMNLEDARKGGGLIEVSKAVEAVAAARAAAGDIPFVINARCDAYFTKVDGDPFEIAVERGRAYLKAGANCIFLPGLRDVATIERYLKIVDAPVNILAGPGTPPLATLHKAGVARVSAGSQPMRAALTAGKRAAEEMRDQGTYTFAEQSITHAQVNALLS
jgi:2-methylisocitrate lyase-like PEP mutase family enzyme